MSDKGFSLYNQYLDGSEAALEKLVQQYSDPLIRFAYCYVANAAEAEDIMEDTIVALILKRKRLTDGDALHGYLYKTARNKAIDCLRRRSRREVPLEDVENVLSTGDLETDTSRRARNQAVYRCMQTLPEQYKEVLHLTYFEGFPHQKSAKYLKNPPSRYTISSPGANPLCGNFS